MKKAKYFTLGILVTSLCVLVIFPSTLELEHREPQRIVHDRILFNADKLIDQLAEERAAAYNEALRVAIEENRFEDAKSLSIEKYSTLEKLRQDQRDLRRLEASQAERLAAQYVPIK